jgi:uncharacterized protein YgfB (UPF0149 family)
MNPHKTTASSWPLILIAVALVGAGFSYHFTLESRFAAIEQKLDQNSLALQQYQASQETIFSSKTAALDNLGKEVDSLQASLKPLGNATQEQNQSLADIRKQIGSLQQLQQNQQDAQKKLADYAAQLEKIRHDMQAQSAQASTPPATAPAPVTVTPSASTPAPSAGPTQHASVGLPPSLPPHAGDDGVDLRPAQITVEDDPSVRALPDAMPVVVSASDVR